MWVIKFYNRIELTCSSMFLNALLSPCLPQVVIVLLLSVKQNKKQKKKSISSFVLITPCEIKQFEVFPHITNFLLISTVFLVQWNLNGIKFTFQMISRYFCSTKTLTLTLSIFWTDQSEGERRRQAIQPLLKHQPLEIQNIELRPDHNTGNSMPYFFQ